MNKDSTNGAKYAKKKAIKAVAITQSGQKKEECLVVLKPEITAVKWVDKKGKEVSNGKYGKEICLSVETKDAYNCWLFICVNCDSWEKPLRRLVKVEYYSMFTELTTTSFTLLSEWNKNKTIQGDKLRAEIWVLWEHSNFLTEFAKNVSNDLYLKELNVYLEGGKTLFQCNNFMFITHNNKSAKAKEIPLKKIIIVIDPGHGGKDPGVPAYKGKRHEKDIVLITGKFLNELLSNQFKVIMTREDDIFPTLQDRVRISKNANADFFISIHVDSGGVDKTDPITKIKTTTYNNTVDTVRVFKRKQNKISDEDYKNTSKLAKNVTEELDKVKESSKSVQNTEASHHVTREQNNQTGAILIEIGFITNKKQEDLMNSDTYLRTIAKAINDGVMLTINEPY